MRTIMAKRSLLYLIIFVLSIFPLYTTLIKNNSPLAFWLVGLVGLGAYASVRTRSFRSAPESGLWVGCLSALLVNGGILYQSVMGPLQLIGFHSLTPAEQNVAYGWLPLLYLCLIFICLGLSCVIMTVSLVCASLGGLLGSLFQAVTHSASRPAVKS